MTKLLLAEQQVVNMQALQQRCEMQCEAVILFETQSWAIEQQIPAELLGLGKPKHWLSHWDTAEVRLGDMETALQPAGLNDWGQGITATCPNSG